MVDEKRFNSIRNRSANSRKTGALFYTPENNSPKTGAFRAVLQDFCTPKTGDYSIYTSLYRILSKVNIRAISGRVFPIAVRSLGQHLTRHFKKQRLRISGFMIYDIVLQQDLSRTELTFIRLRNCSAISL